MARILYGITMGLLLVMAADRTWARIVTETLPYTHEGESLAGYLAYDDMREGKRPGVLVVHEWWGLNEHAKDYARRLAEMGYVALAVDMYGEGKATEDPAQAREWSGRFRGQPLMRTRARAALDALLQTGRADEAKLAAIGFCFGGSTVLELAYSGAPLKGVVSFHGGLPAPKPEDYPNIQASILVLHGAADPHVTQEEIQAFQQAMEQSKADWTMVYFGGALHSFTNPESSLREMEGVGFDEEAARRAWRQMRYFLRECFNEQFGRGGQWDGVRTLRSSGPSDASGENRQ